VKLRIAVSVYTAVFVCTAFCILYILHCTACSPAAKQPEAKTVAPLCPQRIISTLPSITEILFDIGVGGRIVGVSSFTAYPPEAAAIDKIGGLYDINHEKILSLKPDIVLYSTENESLRQSLTVPGRTLDHRTLQGVLESYTIIGALFGDEVLAAAKNKQAALQNRLNEFAEKAKHRKKLKTLICIDRSRGTGSIQNLFVAGKGSFLTDAVQLAGGENAAESVGLLAPVLSAEGVIGLAPEVIIDLGFTPPGAAAESDLADWQTLGGNVPAVKNKRIYKITDDYATVPGPRTPLLIEKLERILHE
jgi:iron complex transport system substrate-binding protein